MRIIRNLRLPQKPKERRKTITSIIGDCIVHSNLKLIMTIRGKSISALSEETGIDEFTIKKARSSRLILSCELGSLDKIASALEVKLEYLFALLDINGEDKCLKVK